MACQSDAQGFSIQLRVCLTGGGTLAKYQEPLEIPGVRVDAQAYEGYSPSVRAARAPSGGNTKIEGGMVML